MSLLPTNVAHLHFPLLHHPYDHSMQLVFIILLLFAIFSLLLLILFTLWYQSQNRATAIGSTLEDPFFSARFPASETRLQLQVDDDDSGDPQTEGRDNCVVCLSAMDAGGDGGGVGSKVLPGCGHTFHARCIGLWLASCPVCPICRAGVSPELTGELRGEGDGVDEHVISIGGGRSSMFAGERLRREAGPTEDGLFLPFRLFF